MVAGVAFAVRKPERPYSGRPDQETVAAVAARPSNLRLAASVAYFPSCSLEPVLAVPFDTGLVEIGRVERMVPN